MLHVKIQIIGLPVLEKIFKGFLSCMGVAAILVIYENLRSLFPWRLHIKFDFDCPYSYRENDVKLAYACI